MKNSLHTFALSIVLAGAYTFLHYQVTLGLNALLFDLLVLGGLYLVRPQAYHHRYARYAGAGVLLSALEIVLVNSWLSTFTHALCWWVFIGYSQVRSLRFVFFAFLLGLWSLATGWLSALRQLPLFAWKRSLAWPLLRGAGLIVLPLLITIPFFALYYQANTAFAHFFEQLARPFQHLFSWSWTFDSDLLFLTLLGGLLAVAVLYPNRWIPGFLPRFDEQLQWRLQRRRYRWLVLSDMLGIAFRTLALRREYRIGLLSLAALNVLLLIANATDLRFVWLAAGSRSAAELSRYVHEGTYALIASLLLAMVVVLYFFRGNLNFYTQAYRLRLLAQAWLLQNAMLAASVGMRNAHYIQQYGLAYGRIMVAFFLLLVFIGLASLFVKVREKKTIAFILQINFSAALLALLLFSAANWDVLITRWNLRYTQADWSYLTEELSDKNLFLLARQSTRADFTAKREVFQTRIAEQDWRGWNWPDHRNRIYLPEVE